MENLKDLRKKLHQNPELAFEEYKTKATIKEFLIQNSSAKLIDINETGLLALFDNKSKSNILIRADIDALPINEKNDFSHKSMIKGVSHKCGHDGHSSILAGLAKKLSNEMITHSNIYLLFQPAEEIGQGAQAIMNNEFFQKINFHYCFALHNIPSQRKNAIIFKEGNFSSSVISIVIKLSGKTSHAAEPENGINPAYMISDLINQFEMLNNYDDEEEKFKILTPVYCKLGELAYGTSPANAELHYTIRTFSNDNMNKLRELIELRVKNEAEIRDINYDISYLEEFRATENDKKAVDIIRRAANNLDLKLIKKEKPFKWGEDFGLFTENIPGAMFGLGAGENTPALHNENYDFPDDIIDTGVNMFYNIILESKNNV